MMIEQEGHFRCNIVEYALRKVSSGAVGVYIRCRLLELYDQEDWTEYEAQGYETDGTIWIVKKNGELIANNVKSLRQFAGWNGNLVSIADDTWKPTRCQVQVTKESYNGKTSFRASFINGWDSTPGARSLRADEAQQLQSKLSHQLDSIFSQMEPVPAMAAAAGNDEDIPF